MKFEIKARTVDAWMLYCILPFSTLLKCNLPADANALANVAFTSTIELDELKKILHRVENGAAMMESLKVNYD